MIPCISHARTHTDRHILHRQTWLGKLLEAVATEKEDVAATAKAKAQRTQIVNGNNADRQEALEPKVEVASSSQATSRSRTLTILFQSSTTATRAMSMQPY